ncbi:MAG: diguanylate cyclase/phosphodiesterase, partial [Frankiales bacterium]|nr:diguanylate cyclase/phosphodiesterase [Frankiales bacterium]
GRERRCNENHSAESLRSRLPSPVVRRSVLALLCAGSVLLVLTGDQAAVAVQAASAAVMAVLLLRGVRRKDALRRTRLCLLAAVSTGVVAAFLRVGWQVFTGRLPVDLWQADAVTLMWVPCVLAAFVVIPSPGQGRGSRARALTDGSVAASSLWYLMFGLKLADSLAATSTGGAHRLLLLGAPIGDVFVVAAALATYARCASSERRMVGWAGVGLSAIAVSDLLYVMPRNGELLTPSSIAGVANQVGMLLLVAAAASSLRPSQPGCTPLRYATAAAALPFIPLAVDMVMTTRTVMLGQGMRQDQLLPALCVAAALVARQLVSARDKDQLFAELQDSKQALEQELRVDALTGLGNRTLLTESLTVALADPACWPVVVALLDLNDFKVINDNHGHETGDAVLVEMAARLRDCLREGDTVARLGGDEFAVIATGVPDGGAGLGERLRSVFEEPLSVGRQRFAVRASIGLVLCDADMSPPTVLACADVAMYQAKDQRSSASVVQVLTSEGRAAARAKLRVQEAVAAPDLSQFRVVYQPVVELSTGTVRGIEALLRWEHPDLGAVPPDVFIPLAELAGSIFQLGDFVMTTALADLAAMQALTAHRLAVGVNVSPRQLTDASFVDRTLTCLALHGLAPDQLIIEITEQAFEANLEAVAHNLGRLTDAGVSIAVDDFGTGYSSLRYLQMLPVEIMKIDRTFVSEITSEPRACKLVSSIIAMASVMDLQLVAEGIETPAQLQLLRELNCELGQGYLFSKPLPRCEVESLLLSGRTFSVAEVPAPRGARSRVLS